MGSLGLGPSSILRGAALLLGIALLLAFGAAPAAAQDKPRPGGKLVFVVPVNAPCNSIVEPDMDLHWFLTTSPVNFSRHKDTVMDDLYTRQSRAQDPEERRRLLRTFEKRLYDEEVHFIHTFQWQRIVPHLAKVRGWTITPSHYLNQQLDTVWLSE
jgi:peptide/nickel transport system substrate-binding protein